MSWWPNILEYVPPSVREKAISAALAARTDQAVDDLADRARRAATRLHERLTVREVTSASASASASLQNPGSCEICGANHHADV